MIVRFILLMLFVFLGINTVSADTSKTKHDCQAVAEPLLRLKCYDEAAAVAELEAPPTFRKIAIDVLESPAAVAAIAAAILAAIGGIGGPVVQLTIGKRQAAAAQTSADASMLTALNAGNREIARMRLAWIERLRDVLAEYHSILMSAEDGDMPTQAQKLSQLGTQIDLLLNRDDSIQRELWDVADKIYNSDDREERQSYDEALIMAGRAVFKAEWQKIKAEMRGRPFQAGD